MDNEYASRRPTDIAPSKGRYGPLRQAIEDRDFDALMAAITARTIPTPTGCLLWVGTRSEAGYAVALRNPLLLVHRAVSWGSLGFLGPNLRSHPAVHHSCATRHCVAPGHLQPVTALANALEAQTRKAFRLRLKQLDDALREVDPDHPALLQSALYDLEGIPALSASPTEMESLAVRIRRHARSVEREIAAKTLEVKRFKEVLEARRLVAGGLSRTAAAQQLGMDAATLHYWETRLAEVGI